MTEGLYPLTEYSVYAKEVGDMRRKHNALLLVNARKLRKNMPEEERRLWYCYLQKHPLKFCRQKILGSYIADFYCAEANLVIELDGSQHFTETGIEKDTERTEFLNQYGVSVIRIPNSEINKNFEGVCKYIDNYINGLV